MNCKQGDLAVIVQSKDVPEHIGKIIKVGPPIQIAGIDGWEIDGPPIGECKLIADHCLRPIRDQPGDDETLAWAGRPQGVTA